MRDEGMRDEDRRVDMMAVLDLMYLCRKGSAEDHEAGNFKMRDL